MSINFTHKVKLDQPELLETLKYLDQKSYVNFVFVNKNTRKVSSIFETKWFSQYSKFVVKHGKEFTNFAKSCFSQTNYVYDLYYVKTHPSYFTQDQKKFILFLTQNPFKKFLHINDFKEIHQEYINRVKAQRAQRDQSNNIARDPLEEIHNNEAFKAVNTELDNLSKNKELTKDKLDHFIQLLSHDLKEDYVNQAIEQLKRTYEPQITYLNTDEYFDGASNDALDDLTIIEGEDPMTITFDKESIEISEGEWFRDINPKDIKGVSFDVDNGIIKANFSKNRSDRWIMVRDCLGELLDKPYTDYVYTYYFAGVGWRTMKLHGIEALRSLIDVIEGNGLYNRADIDDAAASTYYKEGAAPEPEFVDAIIISPDPNKIVTDGYPEKTTVGGEFYPFYYTKEVEVMKEWYEHAQISDSLAEHNVPKKMFNLNCVCYALERGNLPKDVLDQVKIHCLNRYQKATKLDKIFKSVGLCAKIIREDKNSSKNATKSSYIGAPLNDHKYYIELGLLREPGMLGDHYFHNIEVPITSFFLKNFNEIKHWAESKGKDLKTMFNKQRWNSKKNCYEVKGRNNSSISLLQLLLWTRDNGYFKPYTMNDVLILPSNLYTCIKEEITNLNYTEACSLREIKSKVGQKTKSFVNKFYYADFEASTQGFHKPYCCSYSSRDENEIHTIWGNDCAWQLLEVLEDNSLTYFHNLAYDGRFLAKYGIKSCIKKGGKLMSFKISYKGKNLQFRDSWSMISSKLSDFPSMFDIKDVAKELYPYNYYTQERVCQRGSVGLINEAGKYEIVPWTDEQYKIFNENIDKIPGCRISETEFNMELYCKFYCEQDVNILKIGHNTFRKLVYEELNLDIDKSISISSLANKYFELNVYSKIPELYEYAGVVREFIQGCVKGGRCMTRQNKKWHCTEPLYDYDACSLYPSAVHRLKLPTGKPMIITEDMMKNNFLLDHLMEEQQLEPTTEKFISAFIVDIDITKVGKELAFPIIMKKTKTGNSNCNECCSMRVDNYELEDLIKFQEIEYTIKRGYYWTGAKSDLFSKEMKRIYDLRVQYKKQKNPLQLVLKLLMNSTYGKTIQKPIKTDLVYKQIKKESRSKSPERRFYDEAARYNKKNSALIKEYYTVSNNIVCFEVNKSFDDFFVPNLIGVQILSMSKRIMNEVMCLAEEGDGPSKDGHIMIYYQDTDSIHIPVKDVPLLEQKYKELYGRELRGSNMGQFHPDFESNKIKGDLKSVEAYFLGKKAYCDKLMNDDGEIDYHLRLKGIPNNLLESDGSSGAFKDPMELYKYMYEGGEYKFNLLKLKPSFEMTKDMNIKTRTQFCRKIKF